MKIKILTLSLLLLSLNIHSQNQLNEASFDFWIGEWDLTWKGANGTKGKGINKIEKILDNKVIQENFEDSNSSFKGKSMSVYNPKTKIWHQAWVDNSGGYYDFTGDSINGEKIFKTQMIYNEDEKLQKRMRFYNISKDSLIWDWEQTTDGGKTWQLKWRINYKRMK